LPQTQGIIFEKLHVDGKVYFKLQCKAIFRKIHMDFSL
jgi:hypothetical protein